MLTIEYLREMLDYNPETGVFIWKKKPARAINVGSVAGCNNKQRGYLTIGLNKRIYLAHRLAWFYVYGVWPRKYVDHINGNPSDNRISNLREATNTQNQYNAKLAAHNTSGVKGTCWCVWHKQWKVTLRVNGRTKLIGYFDNLEDAAEARRKAAPIYHGEFARSA